MGAADGGPAEADAEGAAPAGFSFLSCGSSSSFVLFGAFASSAARLAKWVRARFRMWLRPFCETVALTRRMSLSTWTLIGGSTSAPISGVAVASPPAPRGKAPLLRAGPRLALEA